MAGKLGPKAGEWVTDPETGAHICELKHNIGHFDGISLADDFYWPDEPPAEGFIPRGFRQVPTRRGYVIQMHVNGAWWPHVIERPAPPTSLTRIEPEPMTVQRGSLPMGIDVILDLTHRCAKAVRTGGRAEADRIGACIDELERQYPEAKAWIDKRYPGE